MANKESTQYTILVALALCIVCSVIVSTAAVMLKPAQEANKAKDFKRNILQAADMYEAGVSIEEQFKKVETRIVDLETGKFTDAVDPATYDQRKAAKDPNTSEAIAVENDIAKIARMEKYAEVYVADSDHGEVLILPVRGYGLWSTLYGFLAIESDYNTIVGLGFYEHGETPGLGGEVDNPLWKGLWDGKHIYDQNGNVAIQVIKGNVDANTPNGDNKVDGLSGATLTSRGVSNLVQFWLGDYGYGPFLKNLKSGEA